METLEIAFIGGGNMATSLIAGLLADGHPPERLWVSDPDSAKLAHLSARYGVNTRADNNAILEHAGVVVLAVKPQILEQVVRGLAPQWFQRQPLLISIAAGIREQSIEHWLGGRPALVRAMPNTPAMIQAGATALHANQRVTKAQKDVAERILRAVGLTLWVENEELMDGVTALSGSGPAYFFLIMEALEQAGTELGLSGETARLLTLQTALGAARMAMESPDPPAVLRHKVTSPGGTTERAIAVLEQGQLGDLFQQALTAARDRSRELSALLGKH